METTSLELKIAGYQVYAISTGLFGLDGGAMFGTVPKVLWEKSNPPDNKNRIAMEARALLLKGTNRNILIDCGNGKDFVAKYGEKMGGKFAEMFAINNDQANLISSLEKHGLTADMITDVILTHLHFDHAGGATCEKNGQIVPTFTNAKYYVQAANLETAKNPNLRERASYFPANFLPLLENQVLEILDGACELMSGISVQISNGHTLGQQIVKVSDEKNTLIYCGDVIPTASHVRSAWVMGYDLNPLLMIQEKNEILSAASDQNWYLFLEHDPFCDAARVVRNGQDFAIKAQYRL